MNIPSQVMTGETGNPPLALNLHYLITAFGKDNDTTLPYGHHLLGKAMSILYDHALLGPEEIRTYTSASFPASDLDKQIERVRITLQPLSLEEISKLWSGLVTQYRLSVGYEVSVMLLDSTQPKKTPLPVLKRRVLSQAQHDSALSGAQRDSVSEFPDIGAAGRQPGAHGKQPGWNRCGSGVRSSVVERDRRNSSAARRNSDAGHRDRSELANHLAGWVLYGKPAGAASRGDVSSDNESAFICSGAEYHDRSRQCRWAQH